MIVFDASNIKIKNDMIKEKEIKITISSSNYKYYIEKYGPYHTKDIVLIDVKDLIINSTTKITAICDICEKEKIMTYQTYYRIVKDKYYCSCCKGIKTKKTNKDKYGVDFPMQRSDVKDKSKKTLLEKYGIENISQREDIRKIRSERLKDKEYQENMLEGIMSKFGVVNVSKLQYIKEQKEQTLMSNYGVTNPSHSSFLFEKSQKNGKKIKYHSNTNLYYRGTYELHFLNFCFEKNINVIKGPKISFNYKDKNKVYHSDYLLPDFNLICEIKSNYYYDKYLELNLFKEKETKKNGYDFIFIIDKNYSFLLNMNK